jgi:hypothetical protein
MKPESATVITQLLSTNYLKIIHNLLRTTVSNRNELRAEIIRRVDFGNAYY